MQKIMVKVEFVWGGAFHLLTPYVELSLPDDVGTFPLPKASESEKALIAQHPELIAKILKTKHGGFRLCFTPIDEEQAL